MIDLAQAYGPFTVSWIFLLSCLAIPEYSVAYAILQAMFMILYVYLFHILYHKIGSIYPLYYINSHVSLHHDHFMELPRWLNLLIDVITNIGLFVILIGVQYVAGLNLLSNTLIMGVAFTYNLVHIVKYSIIGNEQHTEHHVKSYCNYGPEMLDTLFGTRCSPDAPYQSLTGEIPYAVLGCGLAFGLKQLITPPPNPLLDVSPLQGV